VCFGTASAASPKAHTARLTLCKMMKVCACVCRSVYLPVSVCVCVWVGVGVGVDVCGYVCVLAPPLQLQGGEDS